MTCVFKNCSFSTNIYSTFATHKHRKHNTHSIEDFKTEVLKKYPNPAAFQNDLEVSDDDTELDETLVDAGENLPEVVKKKFGQLLLKLQSNFNVSGKCIDEIVDDLQFLSSAASAPVLKDVVESTLKKHNCEVHSAVISDLVKNLCESHPLSSALGKDGPFSTSFKRSQFMKAHFSVVEPVEYILHNKDNRTFQYVPILQSLLQILKNVEEKDLVTQRKSGCASQYQSFQDGSHFSKNDFLAGDEDRLSLILYIDDFEVCNPLGTSRKIHKVTAVYWVLGNFPAHARSTLASINLAILCKADDTKRFGYQKVLEPLLTDLQSLEKDGIFIPSLGKIMKGTVVSVVADNLGAHSLGGFVENFTGSNVCRFCLGERSQFQTTEVRSGLFQRRDKEQHTVHVETALSSPISTPCYGVKKQCALSEKLQHFHVTSGYPPDVLHDLLEGVVPLELALSFQDFIKKKYFSLVELNTCIQQFPYKWSDQTNRPHVIPSHFAKKRTVGGNAHENWCLLRLLPLIIGLKVPEDDEVWQMLMTLKDIVELAVAPVHTEQSICYLGTLISEHRNRYLEVFPQEKLLPKHHFLEHYPELIQEFGPLAALWTMRFEAKHSFFKKIVRQTGCFRNILLSLAKKHQLMIALHLHDSNVTKSSLSVTTTQQVSVDVLKDGIKDLVQHRYPHVTVVHVANNVHFSGTNYKPGMLLCHGFTADLPDFSEVLQIILVCNELAFVVRLLSTWYNEHFRSYELEHTGNIQILEQKEMVDYYPLAAYTVAGRRLTTLKHYISPSV